MFEPVENGNRLRLVWLSLGLHGWASVSGHTDSENALGLGWSWIPVDEILMYRNGRIPVKWIDLIGPFSTRPIHSTGLSHKARDCMAGLESLGIWILKCFGPGLDAAPYAPKKPIINFSSDVYIVLSFIFMRSP